MSNRSAAVSLSSRTVKIYANAYDPVARAMADTAQETADGLPLNVVVPASGSTLTLTDLRPVYVNSAATLAALTVKLPAATERNSIDVGYARPVTALTVQNPDGTPVAGSPANAYGPGSAHVYRYVSDAIGWTYWK